MPIHKREPYFFPEGLLENPDPLQLWYVIQTKSRQEKALARRLREESIPHYLPQYEKQIRRADRSFRSYLPLFPGYVFLRGTPRERLFALRTDCALRVLAVGDQGGLQAELVSVQKLLQSGRPIIPLRYVAVGDRVRIVSGSLRDVEGIVLREKGALRLVVSVRFISASVAVEVDRACVDRSSATRYREAMLREAAS